MRSEGADPWYPEYKDSGIEWLGEVPKHWQVVPLGVITKEFRTGPFGSQLHRSDYVEEAIPVINPSNIQDGRIIPDWANTVTDAMRERLSQHIMHRGDLVIGRRGELGRCAVVQEREKGWMCGTGCIRLILHSYCVPEYIAALFMASGLRETLLLASVGSTMDNLNTGILSRLPIPVPQMDEQQHIAAFLDRETARIDTLIQKQDRLIALLTEKRQAVISHAVTKGLDPNVPVKDSGIEWLGDVPTHWKVLPLRYVARLESGHTPSRSHPEYWENCTVPWFTLGDVWQLRDGRQEFVYETKELVSELGLANSSARLLPAGTVILSRTASVGFAAIMGIDMATTQDFANWVCSKHLRPRYLLNVFRSMQAEFSRLKYGSTHNTIYMPDIQAFKGPIPPVSEQEHICAFLDRETAKIDTLTVKAQRSIELMRERRSALISAAVTGKIDVREAV